MQDARSGPGPGHQLGPPGIDPDAAAARRALWSAAAVRERSAEVTASVEAGEGTHFRYVAARLDAAAERVAALVRERFPDLAIPLHSRWRHFEAGGGVARWPALLAEAGDPAPAERARIGVELAAVSVLLDAGAGPEWRFAEAASGRAFARSEGLALATLEAYRRGVFSGVPGEPRRVDAAALAALTPEALGEAFQIGPGNRLLGLAGRVALLQRLGASAGPGTGNPLFGPDGRLGGFYDRLRAAHPRRVLAAPDVLAAVLEGLAGAWSGREALGGVALGDVWRHPAVRRPDLTDRLVPLHKLPQWLTYSLVEPLGEGGLTVSGLDGLTALAEYRNGGLLLDLGALALRDPAALARRHPVGDPLVVEWRALTVTLVDRLAERVRAALGVDARRLPLARLLEGGTWLAGRRVAYERRPDGSPPLAVESDGTVF